MGQVMLGETINWPCVPCDEFPTPCFEELPKTFKQCLKMHQKLKLVPKKCALCGCKLRVKRLKSGGAILRCTKLKRHKDMGYEAKEYIANARPAWMVANRTYISQR